MNSNNYTFNINNKNKLDSKRSLRADSTSKANISYTNYRKNNEKKEDVFNRLYNENKSSKLKTKSNTEINNSRFKDNKSLNSSNNISFNNGQTSINKDNYNKVKNIKPIKGKFTKFNKFYFKFIEM